MARFSESELERRLSAQGFKLTRQRQAVLGVIATSRERFSPAEVYEKARTICPSVGLATVYRTLNILAGLGMVKRVHLANGCHSYALTEEGHHHYLVCSSCGSVVEFKGFDISTMLEQVASQTGFAIEEHWLQLFGKCPACQRKAIASSSTNASEERR